MVQGIFTALLINSEIHCILLRNIVGLQYFDSSGKKLIVTAESSRVCKPSVQFLNSISTKHIKKKSSCCWHQEIINSKIDTSLKLSLSLHVNMLKLSFHDKDLCDMTTGVRNNTQAVCFTFHRFDYLLCLWKWPH